jgi:hypothetical protein
MTTAANSSKTVLPKEISAMMNTMTGLSKRWGRPSIRMITIIRHILNNCCRMLIRTELIRLPNSNGCRAIEETSKKLKRWSKSMLGK